VPRPEVDFAFRPRCITGDNESEKPGPGISLELGRDGPFTGFNSGTFALYSLPSSRRRDFWLARSQILFGIAISWKSCCACFNSASTLATSEIHPVR
jgi:hypothetical protein